MNLLYGRVRTTGINLLFGKIFACVGWGFDGSRSGRHFYKMPKKGVENRNAAFLGAWNCSMV